MFDFVHRKKRVVQVILGLITLPFAFWGVDSYLRGGGSSAALATVGGQEITQAEFDQSLRDQQDRMRQALGANYDPAVFDNPEVRFSVLDQLVNQRLLANVAAKDRFAVSDLQLAQFIAELPPFQENGKFSPAKYEQLLAGQNMNAPMFEQRLRQELRLGPVQEPVAGANIVAQSSVARYVALLDQKRDVAVATVGIDSFQRQVKVDDAQVKAFYDSNQAAFNTPEQVKLEYVSLTPEAMASQSTVDVAEAKRQYDENIKQYTQPEQRQASHILIAVKPDATDQQKAAARKKAEDLVQQLKKNPAQFAELAKKNSEDPGSSAQGGDLGSFARDGSMVKPFEDAVFGMKPGEIVGPVQTDFGFHVIKLTAVRPQKQRPFEEVRGEIEQDLKRQKAAKRFAEAAEQFQNLVYEQADSLVPVAKALNLKVETTPLIGRPQVQALAHNNGKLVQAVFSPESLQAKRNTEAIEVAPNTLMAARVTEYKPATPRPFDEVKADIRRQLEHKAASELAQKTGAEKLAQLQEGKDAGLSFGKPVTVGRNDTQAGVPPDALAKVFQMPATKLPAYMGVNADDGGYAIYKLVNVATPATPDPARITALSTRLDEQIGRELLSAYLASLKSRAEVKINQAALEKK